VIIDTTKNIKLFSSTFNVYTFVESSSFTFPKIHPSAFHDSTIPDKQVPFATARFPLRRIFNFISMHFTNTDIHSLMYCRWHYLSAIPYFLTDLDNFECGDRVLFVSFFFVFFLQIIAQWNLRSIQAFVSKDHSHLFSYNRVNFSRTL